MNSPNKLYEELLKEHPELKHSSQDLQEIITSLQKVNPAVQIDEDFKLNLKNRLDAIAKYNPAKSPGYFSALKYLIPVFTFGFAIFGFVYFSDEFEQPVQQEIGGFEPQMLMLKSDIKKEDEQNMPEMIMEMSDIESLEILDNQNEESEGSDVNIHGFSRTMTRNENTGNNEEADINGKTSTPETMMIQSEPVSLKTNANTSGMNGNGETSVDDISNKIPDDITPMLFSIPNTEPQENISGDPTEGFADEIMEEIFQDLSEDILDDSESTEIEPSSIQMMMSDEIFDEFNRICLDSKGQISNLLEGKRECILEKTKCLESDFELQKCLIQK